MSGKMRLDYVAVFEEIKSKLGVMQVQKFVIDYERSAWCAVKDVWHSVTVKGCLFTQIIIIYNNT